MGMPNRWYVSAVRAAGSASFCSCTAESTAGSIAQSLVFFARTTSAMTQTASRAPVRAYGKMRCGGWFWGGWFCEVWFRFLVRDGAA